MKKLNLERWKTLLYIGAGLAAGVSGSAEPFIYKGRDLLLGMRLTDGAAEMVVSLGQATRFYNASPGQTIAITEFSPAQLAAAFGTRENILWSVSGTTRLGDEGDAAIPVPTLWLTRARTTAGERSVPWASRSAFTQGGNANKVNDLGVSTANLSDANLADPMRNTSTVVIETAGEPGSYGLIMGNQANLGGTFQGNLENSTGEPFIGPARSDLYELRPASGNPPGRYLGFFEFRPDGTMIFETAGGVVVEAPLAPVLTASVISSNEVRLEWSNVANETGYKLEHQASASDQWIATSTLAADTNIFNHQNLAAATEYRYRVRSYNSAGESAWSGVATAITASVVLPGLGPVAIESLRRNGDLTQIAFRGTNDLSAKYFLYFTNQAGLSSSVTNWAVSLAMPAMNGNTQSFIDTNSAPNLFYSILATR